MRAGPMGISLLVAVLTLTLVQTASAQEEERDPVLPDIAPRVVEIRGQLEISMPSLQRQPLVGFNPPPQVASIPADRQPFVETYKQESVDLPTSPLDPPRPPEVASLISRSPRNGLIEASAGRYFSRLVRLRTEWPINNPLAVYSRLDYDGSDGHEPLDSEPDAQSSFDALDAVVGLQHSSARAVAGVEVDGFLNNYLLFGAEPSASAGNLPDSPPEREGRGGGVAAWVRTPAASTIDLDARLHFGTTSYEMPLSTTLSSAEEDFFESRESTIDLDADFRVPIAPAQSIRADARFTGTGRDDDGVAGTVQMFDGAGGIKLMLSRGLELTALGRVMGFEADDHMLLATGERVGGESSVHVSADIRANLYPAEGVRLYAQNRPHADHHTLNSLYRMNPYLANGPIVQPTIYTIDARGGAHYVRGAFEVDVYAGYQQAPNFLYFTRATDDEAYGYGSDLLSTGYDDAEIVLFGGDISVNLPVGLNAAVGLTFRDGSLGDDEVDIPYFGPLLGYGSISYAFADGRGFLQATGRYESAREVDTAQSRTIGDFFDMDLEGSYDLTPALGVVLRFQNLSAGYLERWEDFPQAPSVFMAGLRVRW